MILSIAKRELLQHWRGGVLLPLALLVSVLMLAATYSGSQRVRTFENERQAAEQVDRDVWVGQGERNPHSAAHFSRYAFKSVPSLASFDPGVLDYAGLAVWMEAHYQNPAVFRRAEEGEQEWLESLSPAWILQVVAPLVLILLLAPALAGERQDGTLRQLLGSGAHPRSVLLGKVLGSLPATAILVLPALVIVVVALLMAPGTTSGTDLARAAAMVATYVAYLFAFALLAIAVSAFSKTRGTALAILLGLWTLSSVVGPRFAADMATDRSPSPDGQVVSAALSTAARGYRADEELVARDQEALLVKYDVETIEELPINYSGYRLQQSEEFANPLFDSIYGDVDEAHRGQEGVLRVASLALPTLAVSRLSAGFAGTDRVHHRLFTKQAEEHRRVIVKQLNDDLMIHGAGQERYEADEELWAQIQDFEHQPPALSATLGYYRTDVVITLLWVAVAIGLLVWSCRRAVRLEVAR